MKGNRLENIVWAFIHVLENAAVAPYFGIKGRAAGIENPHHRPFPATEAHLISHGKAGVAVGGIVAHDQFGKTRVEHTALNNFDVPPHGEDVGGDAAHLHVGVRSRFA